MNLQHSSLSLLILVVCYHLPGARSGPCEGTAIKVTSSEKSTRSTEFSASDVTEDQYRNPLKCEWLITGSSGKDLFLTLNKLTITDCPPTSFVIYEGNVANPDKEINTVCKNITGDTKLKHSNTGSALVQFNSTVGTFPHAFKISYISHLEVSEPFGSEDRGDVGVILGIVLGIIFLGSLFVAATWFGVKAYYKCRDRDPEPSELTSITNLRSERLRERTMRDDFDTRPTPSREGFTSSSIQRLGREAYC